jgi:hypothetical protein
VRLPQAEWEALKVNARDEQYVAVQASFEGQDIGTVALRFKGSYGFALRVLRTMRAI